MLTKLEGFKDSPIGAGELTVSQSGFGHAPPFPFSSKTDELVSEPIHNNDIKVLTTIFAGYNS